MHGILLLECKLLEFNYLCCLLASIWYDVIFKSWMNMCIYCVTLPLKISILQKIDYCVDDSSLLGCDAKSMEKTDYCVDDSSLLGCVAMSLGKWFTLFWRNGLPAPSKVQGLLKVKAMWCHPRWFNPSLCYYEAYKLVAG